MRLEWEIYAAADGSHDGLDEGVTGIRVHRRQRNTSHAEENATLRTMKHQHVVVIDVPPGKQASAKEASPSDPHVKPRRMLPEEKSNGVSQNDAGAKVVVGAATVKAGTLVEAMMLRAMLP